MTAEVFVDTNILLYSVDEDPASLLKRERAGRWGWSVQVAAEFYVNATSRKRPFRMSSSDALALLESWFAYPLLELTPGLVRAAIDVHRRHQVSYGTPQFSPRPGKWAVGQFTARI
jgi:predicted nucleic acid-binding protein